MHTNYQLIFITDQRHSVTIKTDFHKFTGRNLSDGAVYLSIMKMICPYENCYIGSAIKQICIQIAVPTFA